MSTDKTLADVQPGGRVRLGDQAERARFEAFLSRNPLMALCAGTAWQVWQAALSAQPSPGGQGDAVHCGKCKGRGYVDVDVDVDESGSSIGNIESCPHCALAARQPVESEENVAADTYWTLAEMIEPHVQREGINPDGALPASVHDSVAILLEHWLRTRQPVGEPVAAIGTIEEDEGGFVVQLYPSESLPVGAKVYAAPPVQTMDLGPVRVLADHAAGRINHANNGLCPDEVEGHDARDPDCTVCCALTDSQAVGNK